ncbi:MAG TPA: helix-turn-helix domain-containing protein, partial [Ktedonobacterales bacterium]|nr:helix-turn-helix domain-containing protein [Ktedonobacterales bacterium]
YRMNSRAHAVAETRQRIVEAAKDLYARQGILATSYEDISRQAGVSQATVYRQFPSLADLIPACSQSVAVLRPVTPRSVAELFGGLSTARERLELLVRGTCDCYGRDHGWLDALRREEELLPAVRDLTTLQDESMRLLVRAALAGTDASERTIQVLTALIDFRFWQSLSSAGLSHAQAMDQIMELMLDQLSKANIA